jgi:hypothetical protein
MQAVMVLGVSPVLREDTVLGEVRLVNHAREESNARILPCPSLVLWELSAVVAMYPPVRIVQQGR